jgi:hypothetical protein
MSNPQELYHEEIKKLKDFREKLESHSIYTEEFSDDYEELVAQAKVITRVSDRLQKKLDGANLQIREQNDEIKVKNIELTKTIDQLDKAKIGRRASTIMLTVTLVLFVVEQVFIEPWVEANFSNSVYYTYGFLVALFFIVKFLESALEEYFLNQTKKKIIEKQEKEGNLEFEQIKEK